MNEALERLLDRFRETPETTGVKTAFLDYLGELGFDAFSYGGFEHGQPKLYATSYPQPWMERYFEKDYLSADPVIHACRGRLTPVFWSELTHRPLPREGRQVFDEATEFGLVHGLTIPLHGTDGSFALCSAAAERNQAESPREQRHIHRQVHMGILCMHEEMAARRRTAASPPRPELSPRERECLLWTARGKTAWEIAAILALPEIEVSATLEGAMQRMGVRTIMHAVVKAIRLGEIAP